jgi:hypothetical protein
MRRVFLSQKLTSICAFQERHITGPIITYIVVTSSEITKDEYGKIMRRKALRKERRGSQDLAAAGPSVESGDPERDSAIHMS